MATNEVNAILNLMDNNGDINQVYPITKKENIEDLDVMGGASTSAAGSEGLVPTPAAGSATRYLRSDGTWAVPPNTTYAPATSSAHGLMSSTDKAKLDGIEEGANKTVVDAALSGTSTNPVQNKAIKEAIDALPTTSAVNQAISDAIDELIDGAPATYDTLKEIADYLATHEDEYTALLSTVGGKVDKVEGKGLSTNDYTTAEKEKLSNVEAGAEVNIIESVKVNGVAQEVTSKAVDIDMPVIYAQAEQPSAMKAGDLWIQTVE